MPAETTAPVTHRIERIEGGEAWNRLCREFVDAEFVQSYAWGEARRTEGWRPVRLALREGDTPGAAAQVLVRERAGLRLVYCPRGPLWQQRDRAPADRLRALGAFLDALVAQFPWSVLVCDWHVDRDNVPEAELRRLGFRPISASLTSVIDLRADMPTLRAALHRKWRNDLQKGEQAGLEIRRVDAPNHLDKLYTLAGATATRKGFVVGVSQTVVERFTLEHERGTASVFTATVPGGPVVSAALVVTFNGMASYLVGASVSKDHPAFHRGASNLVQWTAIEWAKTGGSVAYNLEGLDPVGNPGVYHFKDRMNGRLVHRRGAWVRTGNRGTTAVMQRLLRRRMP